MLTAKMKVIFSNMAMSAESPSSNLVLITSFGMIRGKVDEEMLNALQDLDDDLAKEISEGAESEPITSFSVITLKDVIIQPTGSIQSSITIGSLSVFTDQVIAVFVETEPPYIVENQQL